MEQYKAKIGGLFSFIKKQEVPLLADINDDGTVKQGSVVIYTDKDGRDWAMRKDKFESAYEKVWDIPEEGQLYLSPTCLVNKIHHVIVKKCELVEVAVKCYPKNEVIIYPANDFKECFKPFKPEKWQAWVSDNMLWEIVHVSDIDVVLRHQSTDSTHTVSITDLVDKFHYCAR